MTRRTIKSGDEADPATPRVRGDQARAGRSDGTAQTPHENAPREEDDERSMDQRRAWAWATALWCLMRIGISEGPRVALLYGSGDEKHSQALEQARQREIDVICLHFDERFEDGPSNIVVVAHGKGGITLSEHCQVWAFRTWSKIEILSETRRFSLGGGSTSLVSKQNNLIETRARGAAAAHQRWRKMAMEIAEEEAMAKPSDADTPPASAEPEPKSAADETLPKT